MLVVAVLSGFALAIAAPWLVRLTRGVTGWILALLPFTLALYFSSVVPQIAAGETIGVSYPWVPSLGVNLSLLLDGLSLLFVLLITGIGSVVLVFSGGYLRGHPQLGSFYAYILMFMASMLGLVLADDVLTMFVFWELTSISSYLLIGFKHQEQASRTAALQALLVTSMGGLSLLAGALLLTQVGGAGRISELVHRAAAVHADPLYLPILLLIVGGAFTKSAQFPFQFWLPSAMQAPTPVSAYLHSATMVKAGVYLLARLSPVLGGTDTWFYLLGTVGAITMLMGAYLSLRHTDLKLILAYSTVSVLGLLTMLLGLGTDEAIRAAVTYLLAHALYKGALFLAAGTVDHEAGTRDVSMLRGLRRAMPLTAAAAGIAALSMAGLPPFAGFLGKELLYEAALHTEFRTIWTGAAVLASVFLVAAALIAGVRPFFGRVMEAKQKVHEGPVSLWIGPLLLAILGATVGLLGGVAGQNLLSPAASAIGNRPLQVEGALFHGFTFTLGLSALTLVAGVALFAKGRAVTWLGHLTSSLEQFGPQRGYFKLIDGLNSLARRQTLIFQSGYLRFYVLATMAATLGLVAYPLFASVGVRWPVSFAGLRLYELGLAVLILVAAFGAVQARSMLASVTALGAVGFSVALVFVLFGAPDVAMTQFSVETLIVILFVLVVHRLPHYSVSSSRAVKIRDAVLCTSLGALMTILVLAAAAVPLDPVVSRYYASNSVPGGHGHNIVNVILVDFRALDTLGEITVLAVAAVGVYALLRLRLSAKEEPE
ncbi:MAG TPA: putative monovalent cation/H+ antiporter subunit A [Terriglobales bacterium]|nr:putative monovalent cation/H+ antiporter subunit A [Terriglobales bacterium]